MLFLLILGGTTLCGQLHVPVPMEQGGVETERLYLLFWNGKEQITVQASLFQNKSGCAYYSIFPAPQESSMIEVSEDIFQSAFGLVDKYFIQKQAGRQPLSVYQAAVEIPELPVCPPASREMWQWTNEKQFTGWLQGKTPQTDGYQDFIQAMRVALRYDLNWQHISHAEMPAGAVMLAPSAYRFPTDKLILPLRMFSDLPGQVSMRILTFTPDYFTFTGAASTYCIPLTESLRISSKEVATLLPGLSSFFQGTAKVPMQMWKLDAPWSRLNRDLVNK